MNFPSACWRRAGAGEHGAERKGAFERRVSGPSRTLRLCWQSRLLEALCQATDGSRLQSCLNPPPASQAVFCRPVISRSWVEGIPALHSCAYICMSLFRHSETRPFLWCFHFSRAWFHPLKALENTFRSLVQSFAYLLSAKWTHVRVWNCNSGECYRAVLLGNRGMWSREFGLGT